MLKSLGPGPGLSFYRSTKVELIWLSTGSERSFLFQPLLGILLMSCLEWLYFSVVWRGTGFFCYRCSRETDRVVSQATATSTATSTATATATSTATAAAAATATANTRASTSPRWTLPASRRPSSSPCGSSVPRWPKSVRPPRHGRPFCSTLLLGFTCESVSPVCYRILVLNAFRWSSTAQKSIGRRMGSRGGCRHLWHLWHPCRRT